MTTPHATAEPNDPLEPTARIDPLVLVPAEPPRRPRRARTTRRPGTAPAGYIQTWALFVDWCAAVDHQALPAASATVLAFLEACPAATATQRRRVAAIDHQHTTARHPAPGDHDDVRNAVGRPSRERVWICPDQDAVDTALRALPSHGFTRGLFGQRDRALLVLAQIAGVSYRAIANLTAGDVHHDPDAGTVTITTRGRMSIVEPVDDPVLCPACALTRWLRTHAVMTRHVATPPLIRHLRAVEPVTDTTPHECRRAVPSAAAMVPLLPPVNQWGHVPFPQTPLTPHAISQQTRDLLAGQLQLHRDRATDPGKHPSDTVAEEPTALQLQPYGPAERDAAWNRRRDDLCQLTKVTADLDDVERRAAELNQRVAELLTRWSLPTAVT